MTLDQGLIFAVLAGLVALLVSGRVRYDVAAFGALIVSVALGLVPGNEAFSGFGHPATVTVALVLIVSRAMGGSGATDAIARMIAPATGRPSTHVGVLAGIGAGLSGFMNNVGTLGLMMPVALQTARKAGRAPGVVLMPLSFGAILGGLVTLIGTPPNIIIATWRGDALGEPFRMFDFTPVGLVTALAGIVFIATIGWRLVPARSAAEPADLFDIEDYLAELRVPEESPVVGATLAEISEKTSDIDAQIVGVFRRGRRLPMAAGRLPVEAGDVLLVETAPESLDSLAKAIGASLDSARGSEDVEAGDAEADDETGRASRLSGEDAVAMEVVVTPDSRLQDRTVDSLHLVRRWGVALLGVSRQGRPHRGRLREFRFRAGDVLLLWGDSERLAQLVQAYGALPLAERGVTIGRRIRPVLPVGLFAAAIGLAAFGILPIAVALGGAALAMVVLRVMPLRETYEAVDWPVIVLLGALIPVGGALETTGATGLIAKGILDVTFGLPAAAVVVLLMVVTMTLSDVLNNAATAVVMAPIAAELGERLSVSPDPFLMAVAVGASCAFLTPIGHQNNALILGPGGYGFGDYWRMGLPLEILIVAVAAPAILVVWPL
ncbi:MAG: SLC13 family permease [Azospirillaceae bacterium]